MKEYTVTGDGIEILAGRIRLSDEIAFHRKHLLKPTDEKGVYEILDRMAFKKGQTFGYEGPELGRNIQINVNNGADVVNEGTEVQEPDNLENVAFTPEQITVADIAKERDTTIKEVIELLADYDVTVHRGADTLALKRWQEISAELDAAEGEDDDGDESEDDETV